MASGCSVCAGSGLLWSELDILCPLCDGDLYWLDDQEDDLSVCPWSDLEGLDQGEVLCFVASQKKRRDRYIAVVTCKEREFMLRDLENVLQITKKKIKPASEDECLQLFGFGSACMPPIGLRSGVEVFLSTSLRYSLELKFVSNTECTTGYRCTWEFLERHYGSDCWIGAFNKGGPQLPCRFWETMDTDNLSHGAAEEWMQIASEQVKAWLSQVGYDTKRFETVIFEEEPKSGEVMSSRYFAPVDHMPSAIGLYGGVTENLFNFLKWNVEWATSRPNFAVAWYTAKDHEEPYEYGLGPVRPIVFPPWLEVLKEHMMKVLGLDEANPPTGCNFNFYKDGSGALNPHSDDEDMFDGMNQEITIVSFSIGQGRTFQIDKNFKNTSKIKAQKKLASLSYLTMEGMFQKHLKHRLPKEPDLTDPRINMTWRWIVPEGERGPKAASFVQTVESKGTSSKKGKRKQ